MICSLNEIEVLARKAARGGGMSWGLAEETGKAVRWLSDHGFPGPWLLAELLEQNDGTPYAQLAPQQSDGTWRARRGPLCPIIAGALICDRADDLTTGAGLRLGQVAVPLMLAPFAAEVSRATGMNVALEWHGLSLILDGNAVAMEGENAALLAPYAGSVNLMPTKEPAFPTPRTSTGRHVSAEVMRTLESFAMRTYAPATEASRAGAGAGVESD